MTDTPQPPASEPSPSAPDGTTLTPEEWDAVRRLRGERAAEVVPVAAVPPVDPVPAAVDTEPVPVAPLPPAEAARRRVALTAAALLLVFAIGSSVLVTLVAAHLSAKHAAAGDDTDAITAATNGVATVLSYNYRSLDHDFARAESLLTPSFRKTYVATTAKAVQPLAAKYKAVSSAQVSAAGVVSSGSGHVEVLVFVDQTVTNSQLAKPRLDRSRINVDLVHHGGRWLINALSPI